MTNKKIICWNRVTLQRQVALDATDPNIVSAAIGIVGDATNTAAKVDCIISWMDRIKLCRNSDAIICRELRRGRAFATLLAGQGTSYDRAVLIGALIQSLDICRHARHEQASIFKYLIEHNTRAERELNTL
jgi:hypothetical protein